MIYLGIDPGKSGSVSVVWGDGEASSMCCRLDWTEHDIANWFDQFDLKGARAVLERVGHMPGNGGFSGRVLGESYGLIKGCLACHKVPYILVSPAKWQRAMGCLTKGDKNISKAAAQRRWPSIKITHRNADSLLLAEYGRLHAWANPQPAEAGER